MKGTYVERDRKKEKKKIKGADAAGAKKGVPGAAAPMVAGVPAAMPVSLAIGVLLVIKWVELMLETGYGYFKTIVTVSLIKIHHGPRV